MKFSKHCMTGNFDRSPSVTDDYSDFALKVNDAIKTVETILDNTRNPCLASPSHTHVYDDKFTLVEFMTNTATTALLQVLDKMMGLESSASSPQQPKETAQQLFQNFMKVVKVVKDQKKSVTMRFLAREQCSFVKEEEIEKEYPTQIVHEITTTNSEVGGSPDRKTVCSKVLQKVKQYHWNVTIEYAIYMYCGDQTSYSAETSLSFIHKKISRNVITMTSDSPYPTAKDCHPIDINITWLLQNLNENLQPEFTRIDRESKSCRTPRNNDQVRQAWDFFTNVNDWFNSVGHYFIMKDDEVISSNKVDVPKTRMSLSSATKNNIFVPVLPIFESISTNKNDDTPMMPLVNDLNVFLEKHFSSMTECIQSVSTNFEQGKFMSSEEATIVLLAFHVSDGIVDMWLHGINHIENMLYTQLYNAIGKHVKSKDLDEFLQSHNQRLFSESYAPEPFCYAIRRPHHDPDGIISIEQVEKNEDNSKDTTKTIHAMTFTRQLETSNGDYAMNIPINSATSVQFQGDLFLHAWMLQRFKKKSSFQIVSRAKQFSSFLLLIGKLTGPDTFEPQHGIILQNKDEILIPLLMDEMPSAKEFKDAISSLSPEQKRFAKAFRSMKLASSVFGVCVVQLKPQLELLLGLDEKSLTKEIRLTQDLLSLFIDYQIPSDLLSYDGNEELDAAAKVEVVKGHVKKVQDMIKDLGTEQLEEARLKADMEYEEESFGFGTTGPQQSAVSFGSPLAHKSLGFGGGFPVQQSKQSVLFKSSREKKKSYISTAPTTELRKQVYDDFEKCKEDEVESANKGNFADLTSIPELMDSKFESFGSDEFGGAVRSTTIEIGDQWNKKYQKNLLSKSITKNLTNDDKKSERNKAYDLLDALSRSGVLPLLHSELHVVIAATHCFDKSVVNTVVQDNTNPIEKIERSNILLASTIHDVEIETLLSNDIDRGRIAEMTKDLITDL